MDRLIYLSMTGAKHSLYQQAINANNLSNATTPGFRNDLASFRALPVVGGGTPTRSFVVDQTTGFDSSAGVVQHTGRDYDLAIQGDGFFAIQTPQGEAYTRGGNFKVDAGGVLQTANGQVVLGDGGPLTIPENSRISVGKDGTISAVNETGSQAVTTVVGRLKLVNADPRTLTKGDDGLIRARDGQPLPEDANVQIVGGALEGSNVDSVDALVSMITHARHFDMQIKMIQSADQNARSLGQLLNLNG
jgi:flagellar basal-body rod protein FlgF